MKELPPPFDSYIKNLSTLITDLKNRHFPEGAGLFTMDTVSMYTNIDTQILIDYTSDFLHRNKDNLPTDFTTMLFLKILEKVMLNNIFSFGNTFWLQLTGTAMETLTACAYATITYGHYENTTILPTFQDNLLYYLRYIDDILGIWLPPKDEPDNWENFKNQLDNWGNLKCKVEQPSNQTTFLDLNINIKDSTISFSTYQKPLNLYLYLPPLSAHPPSCLKGLIKGEVQ
jgi:hypothetical protein